MDDEKTSILLSDVSIEGDLIEKEKIIEDAKVSGDIKADDIKTHQNIVYAKTMKKKNNFTKAETFMIIEDIKFDIEFDEDIFNENKLKK